VSDGFKGKIFATPATRELTGVLLEDSAGIQEDDIKF
jgi:metallo-beta-lactamase family protein